MQLNQIVYNHFHCSHSKESRLAVIVGTNGAGKPPQWKVSKLPRARRGRSVPDSESNTPCSTSSGKRSKHHFA
ncbi:MULTISPECIES: hypothetical protein [unclassified Endozoicomonas]|uniref:hypothetical protein n=1 Tax=unclassified Endozoicomonas TaxID=2644528 RepID=UPI002148276A|nr:MULTISPECIES: hypothetical protein [unclassified Endozoicomonas]